MNALVKGGDGRVAPGVGSGDRQRDPSIETLRGFAILMVVGFHVVSHPSFGEQSGYPLLRHISYTFDGLRMPLFTVISGMVYAFKPVRSALTGFMRGKARRLLIPLITLSTIEFLLRSGIPGVTNTTGGSLWEVYLFGYQHFWFLQAVFLIFLVVGFLDSRGWLSRPAPYAGFLAVALLANVLMPRPAFFSIGASFYLLPHFLVGLGIMRFGDLLPKRRVAGIALLLLAVGMVVHQMVWYGLVTQTITEYRLVLLCIGVGGTTLLVRSGWVARPLIQVGSYAYVIYLLHGITMAPGNRLAQMLFGGTSLALPALFVLAMLSGVGLPILAYRMFRKVNLFRRFVLGLRALPSTKPSATSQPRPQTVQMRPVLREPDLGKAPAMPRRAQG